MAILSYFHKLDESDTEVTYAYGDDPQTLELQLSIDKEALRPRPVIGRPTHRFHATARGIYRRRAPDGSWPDCGVIAS